MADANNIIVDNTIIDYSTINNMVSSLKDLQNQVQSLKDVVKFNENGTSISKALGDVKIEALTLPLSASDTTAVQSITFASAFSQTPTINLSLESPKDLSAKPTVIFSIDPTNYKNITANFSGLTKGGQYIIHAIAIGY